MTPVNKNGIYPLALALIDHSYSRTVPEELSQDLGGSVDSWHVKTLKQVHVSHSQHQRGQAMLVWKIYIQELFRCLWKREAFIYIMDVYLY